MRHPLIIESVKEPKKYDQDVVLVLDDFLDGSASGPAMPEDAMKQLIANGDRMARKDGCDMMCAPHILPLPSR